MRAIKSTSLPTITTTGFRMYRPTANGYHTSPSSKAKSSPATILSISTFISGLCRLMAAPQKLLPTCMADKVPIILHHGHPTASTSHLLATHLFYFQYFQQANDRQGMDFMKTYFAYILPLGSGEIC